MNVKVTFSENDRSFDAKYENLQVVSTGEGGGTGEDGGYYLPTVSEDGNLSWEASKDGMPDVATVNVRGPQGIPGEPGAAGNDGKDGYTPVKGVDYVDGTDGKDGKDGYTPVKGVDYFDGVDGKDGVSGVYVGSGDMPEGYNVQIDPNGSATDIIDMVLAALPVYDGEVESV